MSLSGLEIYLKNISAVWKDLTEHLVLQIVLSNCFLLEIHWTLILKLNEGH